MITWLAECLQLYHLIFQNKKKPQKIQEELPEYLYKFYFKKLKYEQMQTQLDGMSKELLIKSWLNNYQGNFKSIKGEELSRKKSFIKAMRASRRLSRTSDPFRVGYRHKKWKEKNKDAFIPKITSLASTKQSMYKHNPNESVSSEMMNVSMYSDPFLLFKRIKMTNNQLSSPKNRLKPSNSPKKAWLTQSLTAWANWSLNSSLSRTPKIHSTLQNSLPTPKNRQSSLKTPLNNTLKRKHGLKHPHSSFTRKRVPKGYNLSAIYSSIMTFN